MGRSAGGCRARKTKEEPCNGRDRGADLATYAVADGVRMWRVLPHVARQVIRSRYSSSIESSARRLMAQGRLKHEWPVQDEQQERTVALFQVFNRGVK